MAQNDRSGDDGGSSEGHGSVEEAADGRMIYHLFAVEERRRIVSSFLDNHTVAFSPTAVSNAADISRERAEQMLESLAAVGFLHAHDAGDVVAIVESEETPVSGYVGNTDEESTFYTLDRGSKLTKSLATADVAASNDAASFLRAAPDIDFDG